MDGRDRQMDSKSKRLSFAETFIRILVLPKPSLLLVCFLPAQPVAPSFSVNSSDAAGQTERKTKSTRLD